VAKVVYSKSRLDRNDVALNLLSFASGSADVLSFVVLSGVFTSAMTGNTALLGLALGAGQLGGTSRTLDALVAFLCGVIVATLLQGEGVHRHELRAVLGGEALCLGLSAIIWGFAGQPVAADLTYLLIFLIATGMGMQSVAARIFNLPGIPTVVFTSTLTSIAMAVTLAVKRRTPIALETRRQVVVFCSYFIGGLLAGALVSSHVGIVVLLPFVAVLSTLGLQFRSES
jgi:uncharacterized membrane protein YoaK (UPF0700 family)